MEAVMVIVTRSLDVVSATILEATVVYVNVEFADIIAPDARFWAFLVVTVHLLWRMANLADRLLPLVVASSCKLRRNLGLTMIRESVFSQFCYRKDG